MPDAIILFRKKKFGILNSKIKRDKLQYIVYMHIFIFKIYYILNIVYIIYVYIYICMYTKFMYLCIMYLPPSAHKCISCTTICVQT